MVYSITDSKYDVIKSIHYYSKVVLVAITDFLSSEVWVLHQGRRALGLWLQIREGWHISGSPSATSTWQPGTISVGVRGAAMHADETDAELEAPDVHGDDVDISTSWRQGDGP